jgi:peptidylprolyl isomerase
MAQAKKGDNVKVNYKGTLDDGSVFDSSEGKEPLEFNIGEGMLIPAFETAVTGLNPGEKITVKILPAEAYGPRMDEALIVVPRIDIPEHIKPEVGLQLQLMGPDGNAVFAQVTAMTETEVTLDGNHPLAGKDLTFEIELVSIT